MEDQLLSHAVLQGELDNPKNGESAHKHLKQQVSPSALLMGGVGGSCEAPGTFLLPAASEAPLLLTRPLSWVTWRLWGC